MYMEIEEVKSNDIGATSAEQGKEARDLVAEARAAFVAMIRDENFYMDHPSSHWSLKQHWSGAAGGFHDHRLQQRWHDFEKGWKAAKGFKYF